MVESRPHDGGEAEQVTNLPLDVKNLLLSRDGRHMALTMEVFPGGQGAEGTKQKLAEVVKRKSTGRVHDRIFVRHWDAWNDGRRSHLFVMPVTGKGEPVDVPSKENLELAHVTEFLDAVKVQLTSVASARLNRPKPTQKANRRRVTSNREPG